MTRLEASTAIALDRIMCQAPTCPHLAEYMVHSDSTKPPVRFLCRQHAEDW